MVGYSPRGHKELDTTELDTLLLLFFFHYNKSISREKNKRCQSVYLDMVVFNWEMKMTLKKESCLACALATVMSDFATP